MIYRQLQKIKKDNGGWETLELVILLPLLLFLVFSSVTFIFAIYAKICVLDAAREASRNVALSGTSNSQDANSAAMVKAKEVLSDLGLDSTLLDTVDVQFTEATDDTDIVYVRVELNYKQPSIFPFLPKLIGGNPWDDYFLLKAKSTFKKERGPKE